MPTSTGGSDTHSNERLEFLGDSILGLVVADHLYRTRPDLPEGDLTRIRAALVCENSLVEVAQSLDLGSYLRLGKGRTTAAAGPAPPSKPMRWRRCWLPSIWTEALARPGS